MSQTSALRRLLHVAVLGIVSAACSFAALVVSPGVTFNVIETGGNFFSPDVRGTALVTQVPTLEFAYLTDFGAPLSPNTALFGTNETASEVIGVAFDVNNFSFLGDDIVVFGLGGPFTAVTNAALTDLLGLNAYRFVFTASVPFSDYNVLTYTLTDIIPQNDEVPEPGTVAAGLVSLGMVFVVRKYRKQ